MMEAESRLGALISSAGATGLAQGVDPTRRGGFVGNVATLKIQAEFDRAP